MAIIDNLPSVTAPATGDELPIERGTTTYKITYDNLSDAILGEIGDNPVPCIVLASTDTTWDKIFPKLAAITTSRTATIFINGNAARVITDGKTSQGLAGTVCRQAADTFAFMVHPLLANVSSVYTWRVTGASAEGATYGNMYRYNGTVM